jgi:diaminopimelate epimerase
MQTINFTKMVAAGNDFVIVCSLSLPTSALKNLAQKICERKYGIGADGLLTVDKSKIADVRMRIFNADGSEAEMCGNGARCVAFYISRQSSFLSRQLKIKTKTSSLLSRQLKIETKAGIIDARICNSQVRIKLTRPKLIKLDIPLKINNRILKVNFINTGVPHCVVFVEGLEQIDVFSLGRQIRYHRQFAKAGTNVDFIEVVKKNSIRIRTYERGVEDETLACGTGSVAAALIYSLKLSLLGPQRINVLTRSKELLKIYFNKSLASFQDIWLEGNVKMVYKGAYYV